MSQATNRDILNVGTTWALVPQNGGSAIQHDGVLELSVANESNIPTAPIEQGSYAAYNKIATPLDVTVTIASQQEDSLQSELIRVLDALVADTTLITLVTPTAVYKNLSADSFSYSRQSNSGAKLLIAELHFIEIREVTTSVVTKTKRVTSAKKRRTGQTQTRPVTSSNSAAYDILAKLGLGK